MTILETIAAIVGRIIGFGATAIGADVEDYSEDYDIEDGQGEEGIDPYRDYGMDLETVQGYGKTVMLRSDAARALADLTAAARDAGFDEPLLLPVSGWRSEEKQISLWESALSRHGDEKEARKWVAKPRSLGGKGSNHQQGTAVDLWLGVPISSSNTDQMRLTAVWQWLDGNAGRFGFKPYAVEPWHWNYEG